MSRHNPNAKTFIAKMNHFAETLEKFMASPAFSDCLVQHACHTRQWHYSHQVLRVELLPGGTWVTDPASAWRTVGCMITLTQINFHSRCMEQTGEPRDFEEILLSNPEEARCIAEKLYVHQEAYIKKRAREHFAWMRQRGSLD